MNDQLHKLGLEHAYGTLKSITHTLALTAMLGLVALPVNAQATAQDFADEHNQRVIADCENRPGYRWSGTNQYGECVRDGSNDNGGGGLFGALILAGIGAVICYATDCLDQE